MTDVRHKTVLAEIITSNIVGGLHLQRVGELLIARERMNDRALRRKKDSSASSSGIDFIEEVLALEERYCAAWEACVQGNREWRHEIGLKRLEETLKEATDFFNRIADQ